MTPPGIDFTELVNSVIILLTAVIGWLAVQVGRRTPPRAPVEAVKMEGAAIISSEPMLALARAVEANNAIQIKTQDIDTRRLAAIEDLTEELKELRNEMARHRNPTG